MLGFEIITYLKCDDLSLINCCHGGLVSGTRYPSNNTHCRRWSPHCSIYHLEINFSLIDMLGLMCSYVRCPECYDFSSTTRKATHNKHKPHLSLHLQQGGVQWVHNHHFNPCATVHTNPHPSLHQLLLCLGGHNHSFPVTWDTTLWRIMWPHCLQKVPALEIWSTLCYS